MEFLKNVLKCTHNFFIMWIFCELSRISHICLYSNFILIISKNEASMQELIIKSYKEASNT